ncbi:MAG: formylglycine-generating enzyme family protein [Prochloraceae cyanobacterium]|nr:formylglycine-generating enzyme family protein [Prochloraceae cyanobacterium]
MFIFQKQSLKRRTILKAAGFTGLGMAAAIIKPTKSELFESTKQLDLKWFNFQTVRLDRSGQEVARDRKQAQYVSENLENGIQLEMVRIPAGMFVMGGTIKNEIPQHQVRIPSFFLGKFPVTQAQWQRVASFAKIKRDLFLFPSYFRSDNLPVESISWFDAMEFCARLSQKTGRTYRLPSEAEWEYASRAGTTSPFHFGPTISTNLANYYGICPYRKGATGKYRGQTTPVGYFQVANPFGLYDLHGLVWEWCLDYWHQNYQGSPTDGSAWLENYTNLARVLRGGSWLNFADFCRCATRHCLQPEYRSYYIGFRVVCQT